MIGGFKETDKGVDGVSEKINSVLVTGDLGGTCEIIWFLKRKNGPIWIFKRFMNKKAKKNKLQNLKSAFRPFYFFSRYSIGVRWYSNEASDEDEVVSEILIFYFFSNYWTGFWFGLGRGKFEKMIFLFFLDLILLF